MVLSSYFEANRECLAKVIRRDRKWCPGVLSQHPLFESIRTLLGKKGIPIEKAYRDRDDSATRKTTSSQRLVRPTYGLCLDAPLSHGEPHVSLSSLRPPAPRARRLTLLPCAARLLILPCPLRAGLSRLSVSIQLLNRAQRDCRLLCSSGPGSLVQRSILSMRDAKWIGRNCSPSLDGGARLANPRRMDAFCRWARVYSLRTEFHRWPRIHDTVLMAHEVYVNPSAQKPVPHPETVIA
jgi:hypothetical protein